MQCKCFHLWKCSKGFNGIQVVTHISPRGTKTHGSKTFPRRIIFSLTLHHPIPWTSPPAGRLSTAVSDAVVVEEKLLQTAVFPQSLPQGLAVSGRQHRDGLQSGSVWHWLWSLAGWMTKKNLCGCSTCSCQYLQLHCFWPNHSLCKFSTILRHFNHMSNGQIVK